MERRFGERGPHARVHRGAIRPDRRDDAVTELLGPVAPDMDVDQALHPPQVRHHDRAQRLVELDPGGSETEQPDDGPVAHGWASPPNPPGSGRRTATRWYPAVERFAAQNA